MKRILNFIFLIIIFFSISGCMNDETKIKNTNYQTIDTIEELEDLVVTIIEKADQAVIGVTNYRQGLFGLLTEQGVGSGVIYKAIAHMNDGSTKAIEETRDAEDVKKYEYYAVTNRHVIEDADAVYAYLGHHEAEVEATLLSADDKVDLAVIKFEFYTYIQPLVFGDSDTVQRGAFAIAIGSPSGYDFFGSATFGTISHEQRYLADDINNDGISEWDAEYIQHDVTINPGNSGGPLLNLQGEIIGINTMKLVDAQIEKMGFSIPSNVIVDLIPILEAGQVPKRALLGITSNQVRTLSLDQKRSLGIPESLNNGLYIVSVVPNGVADIAGIRAADIILEFNNVAIRYSYEIRAELGKIIIGSGQVVEVKVLRNGEILSLELVF